MVDHLSDIGSSASSLQSKEGNQSRQEHLTEQYHPTLNTLPAEIHDNIMRHALGGGVPNSEDPVEDFVTANALRQTNKNFRQTLLDNPGTLGRDFRKLAHDTSEERAEIAIREVGGPAEEKIADRIIARYGPFSPSVSGDIRKSGAVNEVQYHEMSASDAIARHRVDTKDHAHVTQDEEFYSGFKKLPQDIRSLIQKEIGRANSSIETIPHEIRMNIMQEAQDKFRSSQVTPPARGLVERGNDRSDRSGRGS